LKPDMEGKDPLHLGPYLRMRRQRSLAEAIIILSFVLGILSVYAFVAAFLAF